MRLKSFVAGFLVWMLALSAMAEPLKCDVCGALIGTQGFSMEDHVTGERKNVCPDCAKLEEHCFVCLLPVKEGYKKLADGRCLCARDAQDAIDSETQARD